MAALISPIHQPQTHIVPPTTEAKKEISYFFLIESFNTAMNTDNDAQWSCCWIAKKVASVALLVLFPLNVALMPFILLWNLICGGETPTQQPPRPPGPKIPPTNGVLVLPESVISEGRSAGAPKHPQKNSNPPSLANTPPVLSIPKSLPSPKTQHQHFNPNFGVSNNQLQYFDAMNQNMLKNPGPFEFLAEMGKYNKLRNTVWAKTVSLSMYFKNSSEDELRRVLEKPQATSADLEQLRPQLIAAAQAAEASHGPTWKQLVSDPFIEQLKANFPDQEQVIDQLVAFRDKCGDVGALTFFCGYSPKFLAMAKIVNDRVGDELTSPFAILNSTRPIAETVEEATVALIRNFAQPEILKKGEIGPQVIDWMPDHKLDEVRKDFAEKVKDADVRRMFDGKATKDDLKFFYDSKFGQVLADILFEKEQLELVFAAQELNVEFEGNQVDVFGPDLIQGLMAEDINDYKNYFAKTLGSPQDRANTIINKIENGKYGVVYIEETSAPLIEGLSENFHSIEPQHLYGAINALIFLHKDLWEEEYEVIPVETIDALYQETDRKNIIMLVATCKLTGEKFFFAVCHGDSGDPKDGRKQLEIVKTAFLAKQKEIPTLQCMGAIDPNAKKPADLAALKAKFEELDFTVTALLRSCLKMRLGTPMNIKIGLKDLTAGDSQFTLAEKVNGCFALTQQRIGHQTAEELAQELEENRPLTLADFGPTHVDPSDHSSISTRMQRIER